jgi:hypothetical protein
MGYRLNVIQAECGSIVLLKFVESISSKSEPEDKVVDKLRDDLRFTVRTVSGREYLVSTRTIADIIGSDSSVADLAQDIYEKWKHIHQEK